MKTQFKAVFAPPVYAAAAYNQTVVSRKRATYLLRAARSRRANNIQRVDSGYYIKDGNLYLVTA